MDITTVADDLVVLHDGLDVDRHEHLTPATTYTFHGREVTTLARPAGELLCRIATVNDIHFGEVEAGRIDDNPQGPIQRVAAGEAPYPEVMNTGAVAEIAAMNPDAVFAKGDLSADGRPEEWAAFEQHYRATFGDKLHAVRGNHDAYQMQDEYTGDQWVDLDGLSVALLDTVIPGRTTGQISDEQIAWLESHAADADRPVLVMGHHQQWIGANADNGSRGEGYFGLSIESSQRLAALAQRQPRIIGYTAGHTHRHRVRAMNGSGVPTIEVGCVKDFPGTWAEYRVYETAVMQIVHRVSTPEALAWSERCRHLYSDFGIDYESYALGRLEDRCFIIPMR